MENSSIVTMENEYPSEWLQYCKQIEDFITNKAIHIIIHIQVLVLGATLIGIFVLAHQYVRCKIIIHGNLLLLFINIILLSFIYTMSMFAFFFRYWIQLFFYKNACELLTPVWAVPFLYGTYYPYVLGMPSFHFFIMCERARATFIAEKYENEGMKSGIKIVALIWFISIVYMVFVIFTAYADTDRFSHPQGVISMTTEYNSQVNLYVSIFTLPLVIITAFCDWQITRINNAKKKQKSVEIVYGHYSLSRNYQLNENLFTMRLILPLDISYASIYSIFGSTAIALRALKQKMSPHDYQFYYFFVLTLLHFYMLITIFVYIQFVRFIKRKKYEVKENPMQNDQTNIHFKQLNAQWA